MNDPTSRLLGGAFIAALALLIARPARAAQPIFSDGFEAGGTCHWSDGPCGQMVFVPAGTFTMGDPTLWGAYPAHTPYLSAYWIDRNDVTVDQYAACVSAGGCTTADGVYDPTNTNGYQGCNWGSPRSGDNPIKCVDWSHGQSYCAWAGKRYPTEAEWEKAARWTDGRTYPWGEATPTCDYAVMYDANAGGTGCGLDHPGPVGSKPAGASPYGALDMAGNAWQWVNDWYDPSYYSVSPPTNPPGPASSPSGERVLRGGSWSINVVYLRSSSRYYIDPSNWYSDGLGFRCARDG